MANTKLYRNTSESFCLFSYNDRQGRIITVAADNIPMMRWPDGRWCCAANFYMQELYRRGLSRKDRGGTLLIYATNISPLIRFCHKNKTDFLDLTDSQFSFFMKTLRGERSSKNPEVLARDANSVIAIGRKCLDFLAYIGNLYSDNEFVGLGGRIRVQLKEFVIKGRNTRGGKIVKQYWHHNSFPNPDPKNKRLPISTENISKLREAILPASTSIYIRKRRYVLLKLLEITGARRYEVAFLTLDSVRKAAMMKFPMLKMLTVKRRDDNNRLLPISLQDVQFLTEFIEKNRSIIIKKTCLFANDDGYLLVNERTGKRLRPNTITQELSTLCKQAGIDEQACPQMFRHRFITKLFVALIERHSFENEDDFRRALLNHETFKREIQEWTGHVDPNSLDTYLHLAFKEAANYKKTINIVSTTRLIESLSINIQQIKAEIITGMSPTVAAIQMEKLIDCTLIDLQRLGCEGL